MGSVNFIKCTDLWLQRKWALVHGSLLPLSHFKTEPSFALFYTEWICLWDFRLLFACCKLSAPPLFRPRPIRGCFHLPRKQNCLIYHLHASRDQTVSKYSHLAFMWLNGASELIIWHKKAQGRGEREARQGEKLSNALSFSCSKSYFFLDCNLSRGITHAPNKQGIILHLHNWASNNITS